MTSEESMKLPSNPSFMKPKGMVTVDYSQSQAVNDSLP